MLKISSFLLLHSRFHRRSRLTEAIAKVVELGAANFAVLLDFDFGYFRRVKLKSAFNTFSIGNLTDSEGLVYTGSTTTNYDSFKNLDTLFAAFKNAGMDVDGISRTEIRDVFFHLLAFDFINHIHGGNLLKIVYFTL